MLPVEKTKAQIWRGDQFLCDVEYDIGKPVTVNGKLHIQRVVFTLLQEHCAALLKAYDLMLVLADGRRYLIPRPLQRVELACLDCYVESLT
jgi:hypothetical protein